MNKPSKLRQRLSQLISLLLAVAIIASIAIVTRHSLFGNSLETPQTDTMTLSPIVTQLADNELIITTTTDSPGTKGFAGPTPVSLKIVDGKIAQISPLPNDETPSFLQKVIDHGLLNSWNGLTPQQALDKQVDAVTGATYSSRALIDNVHAALTQATLTAPKSQPIQWSYKLIIGFIILLCAVILPMYFHSRLYRTLQLIANVAVLGLWCGSFLCYSNMIGLAADGIDWSIDIITVILLTIAIIMPLFGRYSHYCNWVCPLGAAQELMGKLSRKKIPFTPRQLLAMQYFRQGLWVILMLMLYSGAWLGWIDYELYAAFLLTSAPVVLLIIAALFLILSIFMPRPYCRLICPTGTLLKLAQKSL